MSKPKVTKKFLQGMIDDVANQLWTDLKSEFKESGLTRKQVLNPTGEDLAEHVGDGYEAVVAFDAGYIRALAYIKTLIK